MSLKIDPALGRVTRSESWPDLTISTYRRVAEQIRAGRFADAAAYLDYFHDEALVCRRLYDQWLGSLETYFALKGCDHPTFETIRASVMQLIARAQGTVWDRDAQWDAYVASKDALAGDLRSQAAVRAREEQMLERLKQVKEAWRLSHDLDVDMFLGLFDVVLKRFGEAAIGEMWEQHLIRDWFDKRYARFDVTHNDWAESFRLLALLSFEAMHGHLCGPAREGDVEFEEFADRIELAFDPCGSGGRAYRGEPLDGTGSRMEAPYDFAALQGAYDFTWNKKGICTYCVHCCVLTERLPAMTFGYPVRIIDPPSYPYAAGAKCRYTIYKNPRDIPESVYARIGLRKPSPDQQLGSAHGPFTND